MYLGHRRIKARGFESGFKQDEIPRPLEADKLRELVDKLRQGDKTVSDEIVLNHLGLVIQITGRYVNFFPRKADDVLGVALVALVDAVTRFQYSAVNNEITPYIISSVHGQISNFLKQDQTIRLTQHGFNKFKDKKQDMPKLFSIHDIDADNDEYLHELVIKALQSFDYHESKLEIEELIDKLNLTRLEAIVYRRLCDNESEADIARCLSCSRSSISLVKKALAIKLHPYFFDNPKEKRRHV
jgi:RNA polymerase sigma factor (sigma-70 family)